MNQKKKRRAAVQTDLCVACGCCVKVCPLAAIAVFRGIYAVINEERCVGCGTCAAECPASIITMEEAAG
jgi:Pyruvate/2-oxoacid:ferredoxin oxidoreductase delta subunit